MASIVAVIEVGSSTAKLSMRLTRSAILLALFFGSAIWARGLGAQQNNAGETWKVTSDSSVDNTNPARTMESHTKSGDRVVDKQRVEVLGLDGRYQLASETETETIQMDPTTTRTVVRTYVRDADGQRKLSQVSEAESRNTAGGDAQTVRTTSNLDVNGHLQLVRRDVADTKKISPDASETKTTVYVSDGNGGFAPYLQAQESQKTGADHRTEVKKSTLQIDANGRWQVGEVKESSVKEDGKNRTTEERVSRADVEGRLSEVSRTVGRVTETASGETSNTVETYSIDVPGASEDGKLHLNQRVTTTQKKDAGGEVSEQQVEQPNAGNLSDGLQPSGKTKYTVHYGSGGTQQTKSTELPDGTGKFRVVSSVTQNSDHAPAAPAPAAAAPADKPK